MKYFLIFLFILTSLITTSFNFYIESDVLKTPPDSIKTITLTFVGDLMCHSPQVDYARVTKDSFNFKPVFRYVKQFLSSSDFTAGNLETVTAGSKSGYTGYPLFNSPDEYVEALADAGFDFLFTSNNHSMDRGEKGVLRTIEVIQNFKLNHTGTFSSQEMRDSVKILDINGITAAFLSYSYGANGNAIPKKYLINLIDTVLINKDITKAKLFKPDLIVVYFHFGEEYERTPSSFQKSLAKKTAGYGADLIIGSHPHVIQPFTILKGNHRIDSVMIAYSLGNFLSNQRDRYRDAGIILNIKISKNFTRDSIYFSGHSLTPTWVFKGNTGTKAEYLILPEDPASYSLDFLSETNQQIMSTGFKDTHNHFTKLSVNDR